MSEEKLWAGLEAGARKLLATRDYNAGSLPERIANAGVEAGELLRADRTTREIDEAFIPGVEIFARSVHPQRHRGVFGELGRRDEGRLKEIGFWPKQWASARMFANTAKGFHVHPPAIPAGTDAAKWFQRLFGDERSNYALRPYDDEQWDAMFILQGVVEMLLRDVRAGMPRRTMRLFVDGDNHRGSNNVGIVIPPGVAHAIRAEGSEDVVMVYGTSTSFQPAFEGRIGAEIENAELPKSWQQFLAN